MSQEVDIPDVGQNRIRFEDKEHIKTAVEPQLKYAFGNSLYTHDISETPSGDVVIHLGNELVRDLSDCREEDNVIKFVPIDDIYQIKAEKVGDDYLLEVPERQTIISNYYDRKDEIINKIDISLAKQIYSEITAFGEVSNQLTPIRQILHWTRTREPVHVHDIHTNQRSDQTDDYISVLQELDYIDVDSEGMIWQDSALDSIDLHNVKPNEFNEVILGDVIRRGYTQLVEVLDLTILTHYPRISGAYYYDALQREDPNLWLDIDTILSNIYEYFDTRFKPLYIEEKLAQLSYSNLIYKEGDYVQAEPSVYRDLTVSMEGVI